MMIMCTVLCNVRVRRANLSDNDFMHRKRRVERYYFSGFKQRLSA